MKKLGFLLVGVTILLAVLALVWTPFDPVQATADRLQGPSLEHWMGTDRFGRDVFSRIMAGAQVTVFVGLIAVAIAGGIGVPLGVMAGMKRFDALIMRTSDLMLAFPALLLAIIAGAIWGPSTLTAMLAIGIAGIPSFARVARSGTLQVMTQDYIAAARISKVPGPVIAVRHVLPNIVPLIIVQVSVYFALAILAEAGLSYLGLGTGAPAASWGRMLHDAQTMLGTTPLQAFWPGAAITLTVLGFNMCGDVLREAADPKVRR